MSLVTHKYTPADMSERELQETFAARGHTVDYLLKSLQDQIHSGTLSSFVITGPRGAGKSTIIHMVALRIRQDPELSAAWIPVVFPEEQFNITSLRDLLAATLRVLSEQPVPEAAAWLKKVEDESSDEQSQQFGITALRELSQKIGKRFILFIENLNMLMEEGLDNQMKGTLRRLLMTDPCMMIIGSSVHVFDSLRNYDQAFFNYFGQVPLGRLSAEEVFDVLERRAKFEGNEGFLKSFNTQKAKVRAIVQLSGGNPRLVMMLYELLSQRKVGTIVQYLRQLVDELTPLLKDEMENLPPQQRKIIHALMERGGTAKPADLAGPTRLPLNAVTTLLKRLKDAQFVEVLGGGKGRTANYTVPDQLFAIWYQMRYLRNNRRRIELFVEVIRVWFEESERLRTIQELALKERSSASQSLLESALTAEYFAASLKGAKSERLAIDLAIVNWVRVDIQEAAGACAAFSHETEFGESNIEASDDEKLAQWLLDHNDLSTAIQVSDKIIARSKGNISVLVRALMIRSRIRLKAGELEEAIEDASAVMALPGASKNEVCGAFLMRGFINHRRNEFESAIADLAVPIAAISEVPELAAALVWRGRCWLGLRDMKAASTDFNSIIKLKNIDKNLLAHAYVGKGSIEKDAFKSVSAIKYFNLAIAIPGISKEIEIEALLGRAYVGFFDMNFKAVVSDCTRIIEVEGIPNEVFIRASMSRALAFVFLGYTDKALEDLTMMLALESLDGESNKLTIYLSFMILWRRNDRNALIKLLNLIVSSIKALSLNERMDKIVAFLADVSIMRDKEAWVFAWKTLAEDVESDLRETLDIFKPACLILEGENPAILDKLTPGAREFTKSILAQLEAKTE